MTQGQGDTAVSLTDLLSPNLLHNPGEESIMWTRVNVGEAVPGTVTPLTADFYQYGNAQASAQIFYRLGLQPYAKHILVGGADLNSFVCGKAVVNVDFLRDQMDRMPGTSGDQFEESILGSVRDNVKSKRQLSRYPIAIAKILWLIKTLPAENQALSEENMEWWQERIARISSASIGDAHAIFDEARKRYGYVGAHAGLVAMFSPAILNQVSTPLAKMGAEDDLLTVVSGYGNVKETAMLEQLWDVAKGRSDMAAFLHSYGYMGANAGELESLSWREDTRQIAPIVASNKTSDESERPSHRLEETVHKARTKQQELLEKADFVTRQKLKIGFWMARRLLPIREAGKACMFQVTDVARAAARRMGAIMVDSGKLKSADDIFYLSLELLEKASNEDDADYQAAADAGRDLRERYAAIELPDFFTSEQIADLIREQVGKTAAQAAADKTGEKSAAKANAPSLVKGSAASAGVITGRARVIADPSQTDGFEPGDILICKVTDPGWSALFSIAGALVADIGGMLSHSAIIARELGIPAVVNTRKGTKVIPDGAMITVDGGAGTVEIL